MNKLLIVSSYLIVASLAFCLVVGQQPATNAPVAAGPTPTPPPPSPTPAPPAPVSNCTVMTKPKPDIQSFSLTQGSKTCIVAQFATFLSLGEGKGYIDFGKGAVSLTKSACENSNNQTNPPKLVIEYGTCGELELQINHSNDSRTFVQAINGFYNNASGQVPFSNSTPMFYTTAGHYYKCNAEQAIHMSNPELTLNISNFVLEAYRDVAGSDLYQIVEECALDSGPVSDLVRIGVGICLIALVAIVLVAYFIGRRRWSERSSYESV